MSHGDRVLDFVLTSGKYSQNIRSVVRKLRIYVEARSASILDNTSALPPFQCTAVVAVVHIFISTLHELIDIMLYASTSSAVSLEQPTSLIVLVRPGRPRDPFKSIAT